MYSKHLKYFSIRKKNRVIFKERVKYCTILKSVGILFSFLLFTLTSAFCHVRKDEK